MKKSKWRGFKNKLSRQLIKSIFALYLSFAILVTFVQIFFEMNNVENQIRNELKGVFKSRKKFLRKSLYYVDDKSVESILDEVLEIPTIEGMTISDVHRGKIFKRGIEPSKQNDIHNIKSYLDIQISYKFTIYDEKSKNVLGKGELISSKREVLKRLEISLLLIIINAAIKTFFIWFVMSKVFIKYLENPLNKFSRQIKNLNYENLKEISIKLDKKNELEFLVKNFNKLIEKINFTKDKSRIYRELLEKRAYDSTNILRQKEKKIEDILTNIEIGLLTFGQDFFIDKEYSSHSLELFNTTNEEILKINALDLIFNEKTNLFSKKEQLKKDITFLLETKVDSNFVELLKKLPHKISRNEAGEERPYYLSWKPISGDDLRPRKILVEIGDISKKAS